MQYVITAAFLSGCEVRAIGVRVSPPRTETPYMQSAAS
jgi:hypothetical protein